MCGISSVAFSRSGRLIFSGCDDFVVRVWDTVTVSTSASVSSVVCVRAFLDSFDFFESHEGQIAHPIWLSVLRRTWNRDEPRFL